MASFTLLATLQISKLISGIEIPASQFSWPMAEHKAVRSVSVSSVFASDVAESVILLIDAAKLFWFSVIEESLCCPSWIPMQVNALLCSAPNLSTLLRLSMTADLNLGVPPHRISST